ncbi:MAG: electron transfer flavoprotein-ubiquinone oxidoreductase [Deltaproteobacteria bacterium]|nr:electron transfer flavoprotein-ubiquinone oxidoreductase [Deltaproteobacteria bacterium]
MERESINFDVLIVGGGPAGLSCAIRLIQVAKKNNREIEVALIEKGAEIGTHALSGAVLNPIALKLLIGDYKEKGCPIEADVREDEFYFLAKDKAYKSPKTPKYMHNSGFHIISSSKLCKWLASIAESMGVNIFSGFAGAEVLFKEDGKKIAGVRTGDKGLDKDGGKKGSFEPGIDLLAKVTVFAEGAKGSLVESIAEKLDLFDKNMPQVFEIGIKEVIELGESNYFKTSKGNDIHTLGYPLGLNTVGGGFIYEMKNNRAAIGLIIGLCYKDCELDIYDEFIKFKKHPFIANIIKGGKVIAQGARTVCVGGYYAMPKLAVDGGVFVGGCAGFQNSPGLKGIHLSMYSGMLAADAIIEALEKMDWTSDSLNLYKELFEKSWAKAEIYEGRNFAQAVSKKGILKFLHLGSQYFTKGKGLKDPMSLKPDYKTLKPKSKSSIKKEKHKYDDTLYIDKMTGVFLSKTIHREDQPCHLIIHDIKLCVTTCYKTYNCPCVRFCPGGVYELKTDEAGKEPELSVNFSNCLHCKTCEIKDPYQNIKWTCPEGGDGPGYTIL